MGGYIERVRTPEYDMWMNEEGRFRAEFGPNLGAAVLLVADLEDRRRPFGTIVGPVVLARGGGDGESYALPAAVHAAVLERLAEAGITHQV